MCARFSLYVVLCFAKYQTVVEYSKDVHSVFIKARETSASGHCAIARCLEVAGITPFFVLYSNENKR